MRRQILGHLRSQSWDSQIIFQEKDARVQGQPIKQKTEYS